MPLGGAGLSCFGDLRYGCGVEDVVGAGHVVAAGGMFFGAI